MREQTTFEGQKSPETMLDEAVERNEQSIRRIQSRIEHIRATLEELEDVRSTLSDRQTRRHSRKHRPTCDKK